MRFTIDARLAIFEKKPLVGLDLPCGFDEQKLANSLIDEETKSLLSVQWSTDPSLGLPTQPFEVFVCNNWNPKDWNPKEGAEKHLGEVTLNEGNGFRFWTGNQSPPDRSIYLLGYIAEAEDDTLIFALDETGHRVRESAQKAIRDQYFIIFGPPLGGVGANRRLKIGALQLGSIPSDSQAGLEWQKRTEVAPAMDVGRYRHEVEGVSMSAIEAGVRRLNGNTYARMCAPSPNQDQLNLQVHLENIDDVADAFKQARPFRIIEERLKEIETYPQNGVQLEEGLINWEYLEEVPTNDSFTPMTVYPVGMIHLFKSLGPIEASTFGHLVTIGSHKPAVAVRGEVLDALRNSKKEFGSPFEIIRVVGHFASGQVEAFARISFLDQPVGQQSSMSKLEDPVGRDEPTTTDIDIKLEYGGWLETYFLERKIASEMSGKQLVNEVGSAIERPKLFVPRSILRDGSDAQDPWLVDTRIGLPDDNSTKVKHTVYRRDEFGRWGAPLCSEALTAAYPVEPPRIYSAQVLYDAEHNVDLELVLSRSWKLRMPKDLRLALAVSDDAADSSLTQLVPEGGVTCPALGKNQELRILFDETGNPTVQYPGTGPHPQVAADQVDSGSGLPDDRSYTLLLRLGSAEEIFSGQDNSRFLAVTADAANVRSGQSSRSEPALRQYCKIFDPRPPALLSEPWQLIWSSRPNSQKRVRVLLKAPQSQTGSVRLKGFRVWQATEASLMDFVLEQTEGSLEEARISELPQLLRKITNRAVRTSILQRNISPLLTNAATETAFFAKFDAISERVYPAEEPVELELSSRYEGLVVLLFTGVSHADVETIDIKNADLRVVAVPDRIADPRPTLQVISAIDSSDLVSNACLLVVGSRQPIHPEALRIFWDSGEDFQSEEELMYFLPANQYTRLSVDESRAYLDDIDLLIERMQTPYYAIFLLFLPESWGAHYLTADILSSSPNNPAEEIPSRRAKMVSCFIKPGTGPQLRLYGPNRGQGRVEWYINYSGLPMTVPRGYEPSMLYLEMLDSRVSGGPKQLNVVLDQDMTLSFEEMKLTIKASDTGNFALKAEASGWTSGVRVRLIAVDPLKRQASVVFE